MKPTQDMVLSAFALRADVLWAVHPARLQALTISWNRLIASLDFDVDIQAKQASKKASKRGRAAIIGVSGTLVQRTDWLSVYLGEVGTEDIGRMLDEAIADEDTDAIIFDVNSPGGSAYGVAELGLKVADCPKKTIASINPLAASGAYWIASQCKECDITPSGECGSIGVYLMQVDQSKMLEDAGIKVNIVRAGKSKISSNPFEPLSDAGREELQRRVDDTHDSFIKAVAKGRGVAQSKVKEGYGQGEVYSASRAQSLGMVDKVCTLESILSRYGSTHVSSSSSQSANADIEIRKRKLKIN
jgi:signal peptide peptidase SppA